MYVRQDGIINTRDPEFGDAMIRSSRVQLLRDLCLFVGIDPDARAIVELTVTVSLRNGHKRGVVHVMENITQAHGVATVQDAYKLVPIDGEPSEGAEETEVAQQR